MIRNAVRTLGARAGVASLRATQVPSTARAAHGAALRAASVVGGTAQEKGQGLRRFSDSTAAEGGYGLAEIEHVTSYLMRFSGSTCSPSKVPQCFPIGLSETKERQHQEHCLLFVMRDA